jgi:hypothetical protein
MELKLNLKELALHLVQEPVLVVVLLVQELVLLPLEL